jgi:hypothetical protein
MGAVFPCLLAAQLVLADPVLLPPSEARQASRDELLVGLPAVDRRGLGLIRYLQSLSLNEESRRRIGANIALLGNDDFRQRDRAMRELLTENVGAIIPLRQAARDNDLERKRRAELCLAQLESRHHPGRTEAALRLLARRRPAGSRAAVLTFLPWATEDALFDQALSTLVDLGPLEALDGQVCEHALESSLPSTRAGAALVLGYLGEPAQKSLARKLLADEMPIVRLLSASGLAAHGDREALAELIHLSSGTSPIGFKAHRLLTNLAGKQSPTRPNLVHELSPTYRAQDLACRFVEAIVAPDRGAELKRLAGLPFFISGLTTLRTREDFERVFLSSEARQLNQPKRLQVNSLFVMRGEEYILDAPEDERAFLSELGLANVRAVMMESTDQGKRERGMLLLHFHEQQAQVVGFGQLGKER